MKFKPEAGDFPLDQDSCKADYTQAREPVSYTHLTLPTIYSV